MNKFLLSIAAATALLAPIASAAEQPIYGVWVREGHPTDKLEFYDCSGKLCAKGVLPMLDGSPPPVVLRSAAKTGPNSWKGDLFNPEDGKTYTGKITYDSPTQFTLTGCLMAFLCQSETWTRVSGPPKKAEPKPEAKAEGKSDGKSESKTEGKAESKAPVAEHPEKAQAAAKPTGEKAAKPAADSAKTAKAAKPAEAKSAAPKAQPSHPKPVEDADQ
ncbi:DUF2147 domain-containing protein [Methylocystis sp. IM3]|uniref:DUF2147 domain-containing protein n=1 Tax=unclassified Methylocystis TaxID=2625913 RepID=UPI0030F91D4F